VNDARCERECDYCIRRKIKFGLAASPDRTRTLLAAEAPSLAMLAHDIREDRERRRRYGRATAGALSSATRIGLVVAKVALAGL
jgi:hypothetical protein